MAESSDGGPAFPIHRAIFPSPASTLGEEIDRRKLEAGMTLRDYFAAQSLISVVRVCDADERHKGETMAEMFARKAYALADAMLAERAKRS